MAHSQANHKAIFKLLCSQYGSTVYMYKRWSLATVYTASDVESFKHTSSYGLLNCCISWLLTLHSCGAAFLNLRNNAKSTRCRLHSPVKRQSVVGGRSHSVCSVHMTLRFTRECTTPPHVHPTSTYITACDEFY